MYIKYEALGRVSHTHTRAYMRDTQKTHTMHIRIYKDIYIYIYIHACMHAYVCMYACMYV